MKKEVQRYLLPFDYSEETQQKSIKTAFILAHKLCTTEFPDVKNIDLIIPVKDNLRYSTLGAVLGNNIQAALLKGNKVKLANQAFMTLFTERTYKKFSSTEFIIVVFATQKILDLVDGLPSAKVVIVASEYDEIITRWQKTWNPIIPGSKHQPHDEELLKDPVTIQALKSLSNRVNLSTGLSHPSDRNAAISLFKILKKARIIFDPDSVRAWAMRNNWSPRGADQLMQVASDIKNGKRIRGGDRPSWAENILEIWKKDAQDNT